MPYNPKTRKYEYGSHWDGRPGTKPNGRLKNYKGSPFKESKLSHRKWKKKSKKRNQAMANNRANNWAYGRNMR